MKQIKLHNSKDCATVDDEDYIELSKYKWFAQYNGYTTYVRTSDGKLMHRIILNPEKDEVIDHRDRNALNNTRENIRVCTRAQNTINRGKFKNNKSGHKGIHLDKKKNLWIVQISLGGKRVFKAKRSNLNEAIKINTAKRKEIFGEYYSL